MDIITNSPLYWPILLLYIPFAILWIYLRKRKLPATAISAATNERLDLLPITFSLLDYIKAFIAWLFLFMTVYRVAPGLYHTGKRDDSAPLLVTANNFLADGGDNFGTFATVAGPRLDGGNDLLALVNYLGTFSPVSPPSTDRVNELN